MIENEIEYAGALRDLEYMGRSLAELMTQPLKQPDFDRFSIRRMIARLQEELAQYEAHVSRPESAAAGSEKQAVVTART